MHKFTRHLCHEGGKFKWEKVEFCYDKKVFFIGHKEIYLLLIYFASYKICNNHKKSFHWKCTIKCDYSNWTLINQICNLSLEFESTILNGFSLCMRESHNEYLMKLEEAHHNLNLNLIKAFFFFNFVYLHKIVNIKQQKHVKLISNCDFYNEKGGNKSSKKLRQNIPKKS